MRTSDDEKISLSVEDKKFLKIIIEGLGRIRMVTGVHHCRSSPADHE